MMKNKLCPMGFNCQLMVGRRDKLGTCLNWLECCLLANDNQFSREVNEVHYFNHPIERWEHFCYPKIALVVTNLNLIAGYAPAICVGEKPDSSRNWSIPASFGITYPKWLNGKLTTSDEDFQKFLNWLEEINEQNN